MTETTNIYQILQDALKGADQDKAELLEELTKIQENSKTLRDIIYKPYYGNPTEEIPSEFEDPETFLAKWDSTDRALGNTILMVMPPSIFETPYQNGKEEKEQQQQPIIIAGNQDSKASTPMRLPVKGFLSGFHDVRIAKIELNSKVFREEKPTITTEKVTYDPKDIVYQLIPSLNQIKELYFKYLNRHLSYREPSIYLLKLGHLRLQEEMSKYFNVINPFAIASITFQKEKIRRDKLQLTGHFSRIAEAEAQQNMSMADFYQLVRQRMGPQDAGR